MKKLMTLALAATLALAPAVALTACEGWETMSSGGIAIESVDRDDKGYIVEDAVKEAALTMAEVMDESQCSYLETKLDESSDPVCWTVDFAADGTTYHYVVDAENGDLIDFTTLSL